MFISHGYVDHAGWYEALAVRLSKEIGMTVYVLDHQGWGRSEGFSRGYVKDFGDFSKDLLQLVDSTRPAHRSIFLLGKSMGGLAAVEAAKMRPSLFAGVILASPAIDVTPEVRNRLQGHTRTFLEWIAKYFPTLPFKQLFPIEFMSRSEDVIRDWKEDELVYKGSARLGFLLSINNHIEASVYCPLVASTRDGRLDYGPKYSNIIFCSLRDTS